MNITAFYWREPAWLVFSLLPMIVILMVRYKNHRVLSELFNEALLPWVVVHSLQKKSWFSKSLLFLSWLFFCMALSGPRLPLVIPPDLQAQEDVMMTVIDFSASMNVVDAGFNKNKVSRRKAAQQLLQRWFTQFPMTAKSGMVIFSGHPHLLLKPTEDKHLFFHYLDRIDQVQLPTLGNAVDEAIRLSMKQMEANDGQRIILLLTDGDVDKKTQLRLQNILPELKEKQIQLVIIGIGGIESRRIPLSENRFLTENGKAVISRQESQWLKVLSERPEVTFLKSQKAYLKTLSDTIIFSSEQIHQKDRHKVLWDEWFSVPLSMAIVLLMIALQMETSGRRPLSE